MDRRAYMEQLLCPEHNTHFHIIPDLLLYCPGCKRSWPEHDGVADLRSVRHDQGDEEKQTIDSFQHKWNQNPERLSEERVRLGLERFTQHFPTAFDPGDEEALFRYLREKHRILDAGCGLGHLTNYLAHLAPHADVWGVDITDVVYRIKPEPNVALVRCDLRQLPISREFDLIVSDGVLHHTPDTFASLAALVGRLAPGGDILVYLYKRKSPLRELADDYVRAKTTEMTHKECMEVSADLAELGRQLSEAKVTIDLPRGVPLLGIPSGPINLQRLIYRHFLKCFWDDQGGNGEASVLENFDWYSPPIASRYTKEEIESYVRAGSLGVTLVGIGEDESGYYVQLKKE